MRDTTLIFFDQLFHLEIADSVTGGSWFAEGEPDDDMARYIRVLAAMRSASSFAAWFSKGS